MLKKKMLGYFTLSLLVLVGVSWQNSDAQPPAKSTEGQTGTRERMVVVNGNVTMDLDLNRLKGISSVAEDSKRESVRFDVAPNSFFTILAFNGALRGALPGSMELIGGPSAIFPGPLGASANQLILERLPSESHFELVIRDGKTGFVFFNIEGHLYKYDAAARSLSIHGGRLLISEEFANKLGRPADATAVVGEIAIAVKVDPIEVTTYVNGATKSAVLPPRKGGAPDAPQGGGVPGPDIIVGTMSGLQQFGSTTDHVGLATGATSCNNGDQLFHFYLLPNHDHSVVSQNFYRMSGGASGTDRFEQLGHSWNKHVFGAAQENGCGFGCTPYEDGQEELGVGCSDPYAASQNAEQDNTPFGALGSRAWINPFTGAFPTSPRPENHTGHAHSGTSHRIVVAKNDLNTTMNTGATYYLEVQYDSPQEYAWCQSHPTECNMYNNASYRRYNVSGTTNFTFAAVGSAVRMTPATGAWTGATSATIEPEPGVDGRAFVVYKVTNPSAGVWHYEYAIHNQNLDRSIQSFSIPLGNGITLSNVGFRAPPNHPGFPNDGTVGNAGFSNAAWTSNVASDAVSWNTETFAQNPNANAIRFGTLYNFRFDSNRPPQAVNATIGFLKTGTPITVGIQGPSPDGGASPTPSPTASPTPSEPPQIDIVVGITDSPDPVLVGQNLTYTITVSNNSSVGTSFVPMSDNLPASVNFVSVTTTQGSCTGTASTVSCALGPFPPFGSATVTLVVTPTVAGPLSNTASAQYFGDIAPTNNTATASTTVLPLGTPTPTPTSTPTPPATPTPTPTPTPGVCSWGFGPAFPIPINNEAITSLGGNLYSFGGTTTGNVQVANAYKFDGTTWTPIAPLPQALAGASAVNDGTSIYILGGFTGAVGHNNVYRYNPGANSYTTLAPLATASAGHGAAYLGGKIYKFAGSTTATEIYDIATNQWTAGADYPRSVSSLHAFAHGNFIYGAGGRLSVPLPITISSTYRYDPTTNTWDDAAIADLPEVRAGAASGPYNGGWVLAGGSQSGPLLGSAISWSPNSNTWSSLPFLLAPRMNMGGAALNGSFYVVGGGSLATSFNNDNQKLTCPPAPTPTPTPTPASPTPTPTSPTPTPTSPTPTPSATPAAQAINLSTRMRVLTGDNVGIGGFIITGTVPKHLLIRVIGPSLTDAGVPGALPDPVLELHGPAGFATVTNDNWRDDPAQEALILATGIPPNNDLESAIDATLNPGAYTAVVRGSNNTIGVALIEVYDLGHGVPAKLANISTRAFVSTGNDIVIAGFILGSGSGNDRIIVRGIGPSLADAGVPEVLADPTLELRNSSGTVLFANNDWQDDPIQASEITAAGLAPASNLESGIAATLPPGAYTALLAGLNNGTGNGVVEVYDRGAP